MHCRSALRPRSSAANPLGTSHLPQIAARAHHHILVSKGERGGVTTADTRVLDGDDRVTEVARMLGGDAESEVSRAHARELLQTAAIAPAAAPRARTRKRQADR